MLEDFKDQQPQKHEIRSQWLAQDLKAVFSLLWNKHSYREVNYQDIIQGYPLVDLARMVALVNFLDCPSIFADILLALSQKIDQIKHSAGYELGEQLEEILPRELQKMIQEILLLRHNAISPLIKVTHRIKDPANKDFLYSSVSCSPRASFIAIQLSNPVRLCDMTLYDVSGLSTRKWVYRPGLHGFSPDDKYLYYIDQQGDKIELWALQGGQGHSFDMPPTLQELRCDFSADSKAFIINDSAYCVETGKLLPADSYLRKKSPVDYELAISSIRKRFPEADLAYAKSSHYLAVKPKGSIVFFFDLARPEETQICFSATVGDLSLASGFANQLLSRENNLFLRLSTELKESPRRLDTILHVDLKAQKSYMIPTDTQPRFFFTHNRFLVLSNDAELSMYFFIPCIAQWVLLNIPHNFVRGHIEKYVGGIMSCDLAGPDDNYIIIHGRTTLHEPSARFVERLYLPLDLLLNRCTLKEMMMVLNYTQNPLLLNDPYYKRLYDSLHPGVGGLLDMKTIEDVPEGDESH